MTNSNMTYAQRTKDAPKMEVAEPQEGFREDVIYDICIGPSHVLVYQTSRRKTPFSVMGYCMILYIF